MPTQLLCIAPVDLGDKGNWCEHETHAALPLTQESGFSVSIYETLAESLISLQTGNKNE